MSEKRENEKTRHDYENTQETGASPMSLNAAMICDNCEKTLPLPYEPDSDHEEALESGWFVISTPDTDDDVHLCSETCLAVWAAVRAVEKGTIEVATVAFSVERPRLCLAGASGL